MIDRNDRLEAITKFRFKAKDGTEYSIFDFIYPIGCLYWSNSDTNPSKLFGGTWKQITDTFILACGDKHKPNENGGTENITLTDSNIPSHTHSFTVSGYTSDVDRTNVQLSADGYGMYPYTGHFQVQNRGVQLFVKGNDANIIYTDGVFGTDSSKFNPTVNWRPDHKDFAWGNRAVSLSINTNHKHFCSIQGNTESNNGSKTSLSIMPPYQVKYCFERIA